MSAVRLPIQTRRSVILTKQNQFEADPRRENTQSESQREPSGILRVWKTITSASKQRPLINQSINQSAVYCQRRRLVVILDTRNVTARSLLECNRTPSAKIYIHH